MLFDILNRNLNPFESHFLEASAGTGKTFAIEHLTIRLLLEGDFPFSIEQILIVTFTRAATRELKSRIRRTLMSTQQELLQKNSSKDYLQAILGRDERAIQTAIDRIESALVCFESAQIYTLHGFCHRILKEFAFEAGVGFDICSSEEKDFISLTEKIVEIHLKEELSFPRYSPFQIKILLKKYQDNPRKLISSLAQIAASSKEIAFTPFYDELFTAFSKKLESLPPIDEHFFKKDLDLLLPHYKQMSSAATEDQIELFAKILCSKTCSYDVFDCLLSEECFLEKIRESNKKVRAKLPQASQLHYPTLIDTLKESFLPILKYARDPSRIFLCLASDLKEKCRVIFDISEKFSPDTLLLRVEQALNRPAFVENVRKKFRAAIIDEFQDTDPIQWNIFQKLFLSEHHSVCLVGDPKQSIYAFRNADVCVYLDAAKVMGDRARKHLDTNYRSTSSLVAALNLLFSSAHERWLDLPAIEGKERPLRILNVKAGRQTDSGLISPIEFFIASGKKGRSKKFPTNDLFENTVFPYLAEEINRLHTEEKIDYHEIALLVKDRFQAKAIIDYLKESGIPASAKRRDSVLDSSAYFALKEVLRAVYDPHDMSAVKAALGSAIICWEENEFYDELNATFLFEAKAKMQTLQRVLCEKGFGAFFEAFSNTTWRHKPLLEELFARGDAFLYRDLRVLAEFLIEEEMSVGFCRTSFLSFLENLAFQSHLEESRLRIPSHEEKGSVTVMTTHLSKGLEFEVVFALGLASRQSVSDHVSIKTEGKNLLAPFQNSDPFSELALQEQDAEKMRQLYVALTRAKSRLYIPLILEEDKKEIEKGEGSPSELFFARLSQNSVDYEELYQIANRLDLDCARALLANFMPLIHYRVLEQRPKPYFNTKSHSSFTLTQPIKIPLKKTDYQVLSFSSLVRKENHAEAMVFHPHNNSFHGLPLGAETGTFLHQLFEKIFKRHLHLPHQEKELAALIREEVLFSPFEQYQSLFFPEITELFAKPVCEDFSLSAIPKGNFYPEMEFLFKIPSGFMKGFADLFFSFAGKYYLLDWKSNYLGPTDADYSQEKIADVMRVHQYDLQASIYAEALSRYVKLFDNRPFSDCFGGAIYYFVRGKAAFHFLPTPYTEGS